VHFDFLESLGSNRALPQVGRHATPMKGGDSSEEASKKTSEDDLG
jgi:hypothetical protein